MIRFRLLRGIAILFALATCINFYIYHRGNSINNEESLSKSPVPKTEVEIEPWVTELEKFTETEDPNMPIRRKEAAWLNIMIPTVARVKNGVHLDYLKRTIDALIREFPLIKNNGTMHLERFGQVRVFVFNNKASASHQIFDQLRDLYGHNESMISFIQTQDANAASLIRHILVDPPGSERVVQQSLDVSENLKLIGTTLLEQKVYNSLIMLMEDDFIACPGIFDAIIESVERAEYIEPDWYMLKYSYGLNGILVHLQDALHFSEYLKSHCRRRPPDHLATEFFCGETAESAALKQNRHHFAFRYNLFDHSGTISSLRESENGQFPRCYAELVFDVVFEIESFNKALCSHDLITPCLWEEDALPIKWTVPPK